VASVEWILDVAPVDLGDENGSREIRRAMQVAAELRAPDLEDADVMASGLAQGLRERGIESQTPVLMLIVEGWADDLQPVKLATRCPGIERYRW